MLQRIQFMYIKEKGQIKGFEPLSVESQATVLTIKLYPPKMTFA